MTKTRFKNDARKKIDMSIFKLRPKINHLKSVEKVLEPSNKKKFSIPIDDSENELVLEETKELNNDLDEMDDESLAKTAIKTECDNKTPATLVLIKSTTINNNNDVPPVDEKPIIPTITKKRSIFNFIMQLIQAGVISYAYGFTALKLLPPAITLISTIIPNTWTPDIKLPFNNSIVDFLPTEFLSTIAPDRLVAAATTTFKTTNGYSY